MALETRLTQELIHEGLARDFVRYVQDLRKKANFNIVDRIMVHYSAEGEAADAIARYADYIRQETPAAALTADEPPAGSLTTTLTLGGQRVRVGVMRV